MTSHGQSVQMPEFRPQGTLTTQEVFCRLLLLQSYESGINSEMLKQSKGSPSDDYTREKYDQQLETQHHNYFLGRYATGARPRV